MPSLATRLDTIAKQMQRSLAKPHNMNSSAGRHIKHSSLAANNRIPNETPAITGVFVLSQKEAGDHRPGLSRFAHWCPSCYTTPCRLASCGFCRFGGTLQDGFTIAHLATDGRHPRSIAQQTRAPRTPAATRTATGSMIAVPAARTAARSGRRCRLVWCGCGHGAA